MRYILLFLLLSFLICGCKNKELPARYLSHISVIRNAESKRAEPSVLPAQPAEAEKQPVNKPQRVSAPHYHIIVGSFSNTEKTRAEQLVEKLKTQGHPASLLPASQRYRVSIEGFSTEAEADTALDKYREITGRKDIWVYKVK